MTINGREGDRLLGSLRAADGKGVVSVQDRFDTDMDDLWSALTDPSRLARWYGEVEGDLRLGGQFRANLPGAGDYTGCVDACEPPHRMLLKMRDSDPQPGQPEETVIDAQLIAAGEQTILIVEEGGLPLHLMAAYGAGVQIHVESLAAYLAGREVPGPARWEELLPSYEALAAEIRAE